MFNEPPLFGPPFYFFLCFFSAGAYTRAASSVVECVVRSCVIPRRGGRLAGQPGHTEPEEDKANSLSPLVP